MSLVEYGGLSHHLNVEPKVGTLLGLFLAFSCHSVLTLPCIPPPPYSQTFPIKINLNSRLREFHCKGKGLQPRVAFKPNFADCGPILPKFDGQKPNEARITMVNPCSFPVEVYCLDLDKQYMMDEDVLRNIDAGRYNEAGVMYQLPLDPGQQIWADLAEEAEKKKQADAAAAEAASAAAAEGAADGAVAAAPADDGEVGDLDAVAAAQGGSPAISPASRLVIVLHGPALAGSTTQARLIGERYSLPTITFDDLLFEGADAEAPIAEAAPESSPVEDDVVAESTDAPYFDAAISDLLYEKVLIDPDMESQPGFVAPASKLQEEELNDLLVRGLKQALSVGQRFAPGLVLDGLRSKYCTPGSAAKILMQALGMQAVVPAAAAAAAPKAAKKGGPPEPPPPPPAAEGWNGPHDVFFLTFDATAELVTERLREKKKREAAEKAEAEALASLTDVAASEGGAEPEPEPEPVGEPEAVEEMSEEELAARAAEAAEAAEAELKAEAEALFTSFVSESAAVGEQLGKPDFQSNRAVRHSFDPSGVEPERVMLAACGIKFSLGRVSVALPQLESDAMLIPDPYIMQVIGTAWRLHMWASGMGGCSLLLSK